MLKIAIVKFDEGTINRGIISNIVLCADWSAYTIDVQDGYQKYDCTHYDVKIEDVWEAGKFYHGDVECPYVPSYDEKLTELQNQIDYINEYLNVLFGTEKTEKDITALQYRKAIQLYVQDSITDESDASYLSEIYPTFEELCESKKEYIAGTIFKYGVDSEGNAQLYSFVSNYVPQPLYTPDVDITHYKKFGVSEEGVPIWIQPYGSTDGYHKGDIVFHKDKKWENTFDGINVWEPGVFGWEEVIEEPIEPEPKPEEYPDWVQPTGSHDAYAKDVIVKHNEKLWISLVDGNVWEPGSVGSETVWNEYVTPDTPEKNPEEPKE